MLYYGGRWLNGLGRPLGIETGINGMAMLQLATG